MDRVKILFGLILIDQGIKHLAISLGRFQLNPGIAFGWASQWQGWWWAVDLVLIIWLVSRYKFSRPMVLIISGGFSNWLDRIFRGGVVDYIFLPIVPTFNLSDGLIMAGVLSLMYSLWYGAKNNL